MSVNDKVQVIWKTNCQWKDRPHFPKRKEIKLGNSDGENSYASLKKGDKVKVKFGSRWYDAEVAETWNPKSKKGAKKKSKAKVPAQLETDGSSSNTTQPTDVASSEEPDGEEDHYARFEAEQQQQEDIWRANRTAKRPRIDDLATDTSPGVPVVAVPVVDIHELRSTELTAKLNSKTEECERLRSELEELKEGNGAIEKAQRSLQEQVCKMIEKLEDKMTAAFLRIEQRLENLEVLAADRSPCNDLLTTVVPDLESTTGNTSNIVYETDLSTLDVEAVAEICESQLLTVPLPNPPPPPPPQPASREQPVPIQPSPVISLPAQQISEELIRTCVTPRKVRNVQETLKKATQRHMCALKLLRYFFSQEELSHSNTDGSHNKECLDTTKLNSLKVLLFTKFPAYSSSDEEKQWRHIKTKINAKCRSQRFAFERNLSSNTRSNEA